MDGKRNKEKGTKKEKRRGNWNEENGMRKTELMNGDRNIECGATPTTEASTATTTAVRK